MLKRKACSKNKVAPEYFGIVKEQFLLDIKQLVDLEDIPPALIINWDQTAINYVPPASWTMEVEESKRVDLAGRDDKGRSPFVLQAQWKVIFITPIGVRKTNRCLPQVNFPDGWHVKRNVQDYTDKIILCYINMKKEMKLPSIILHCSCPIILKHSIQRHY